MAIAYVNGTTATQSTAATESLTLNVPSGVANGNLMVVVGVVDSSSVTLATPSGWSQLWTKTQSSCAVACFARVASSEPASYTWTWNASGIGAYACGAWSGVNTSSVVEGAADSGITYTSGSVSTPSATPTAADWMLAIYTDQRASTTGTTWSTPSGMTARAATNVVSISVEVSVAMFDTNAPVAAGTAYSYSSSPTSGTAGVVTGILGIKPPASLPPSLYLRQSVKRAALW